MFAIKNLNSFQKSLNEHVQLLEEMIQLIGDEKELEVGPLEKLSDIYLELMHATSLNFFKECADLCQFTIVLRDNPKANRKVKKALIDSLEVLKDLGADLSDNSNRFKVTKKIELASFQINRLYRAEFYSVWKERQKAS